MVIGDITWTQKNDESSRVPLRISNRLASPQDRVLAFIIDSLFIAPVSSLVASTYIRNLRDYLLESDPSPEFFQTQLLMIVLIVISSACLQALMVRFWGQSPGQKILQIRLKSHTSELSLGRPDFVSLFVRNLGWWFSALLLFFPLFEIYSHPRRRSFYDRLSDIEVATEKNQDSSPLEFEQRVTKRWGRVAALSLVLLFGTQLIEVERSLHRGSLSRQSKEERGYFCSEFNKFGDALEQRLDLAMSLFLNGLTSAECLRKETDFSLWQKDARVYPMAYLGQLLLSLGETRGKAKKLNELSAIQRNYFEATCKESETLESCQLAKSFALGEGLRSSQAKRLSLRTSWLLLLDQRLAEKNPREAWPLLQELLVDSEDLEQVLDEKLIKIVWLFQFDASSRSPANASRESSREYKEALDELKTRFRIP